MKKIIDIAKKINVENIQLYGDYKAKIYDKIEDKPQKSKLILVSAISPTQSGEGKTTMTIGLVDGLNAIGCKTIGALREPSLGPVLAMKGGACGGGKSTIEPMQDINLHFTGDIHAISSANNFICAVIDNHIWRGNKFNIKEVLIGRSVDLNDRVYRNLIIKNSRYEREDKGYISVASEIMAIFCLALDLNDLKKRLNNMVVAITNDNEFITLKEFEITDSIIMLLKDAFFVNLVQSSNNSPFLVHGGPFANIAHGCNSIRATKLALNKADYVVSEAGFAFDLGGEKFLDLKCRIANLRCDLVVLVVSVKAIRSLGGFENDFYNLKKHLKAIKEFNLNVVICLNKFEGDDEKDIEMIREFANNNNYPFEISTAFKDGGSIGSKELAKVVIKELDKETLKINYLYDLNDTFEEKLQKLVTKVYDCDSFILNDQAIKKLNLLKAKNVDKLPLCIAKSPLYLNGKKDNDRIFEVTDLTLSNGAGFIVVSCGSILKMPGLNETFNAQKIKVDDDYNITGLF